MRPNELIKKVNTEKLNLREFSESLGFSSGTIINRLHDFGYGNDESGQWSYLGNPEDEPVDLDITKKGRLLRHKSNINSNRVVGIKTNAEGKLDLFAAIMRMPQSEFLSRAYKTDREIDERFSRLCSKARLNKNLLHSLAIYEFVTKYEPYIETLVGDKEESVSKSEKE
ncbi:hypothetical protein BKP37_06985 [Anaerobacillus alkalilacustris]|uniref:Uncharacterized protein n=1 Tax=Anaerobacillus alkalilacustris TaxID=393763 RepID=A0A1S2LS17_9BACI|nr:hypothetical protein [Anaerobacillus alkalilacustris]OIJ14923.1 hypothetical protein BKP37_06985 [Anaerobacillus alkalilacustris]